MFLGYYQVDVWIYLNCIQFNIYILDTSFSYRGNIHSAGLLEFKASNIQSFSWKEQRAFCLFGYLPDSVYKIRKCLHPARALASGTFWRAWKKEASHLRQFSIWNMSLGILQQKKRNKYNNIMRQDLNRRLFLECLTSWRALFLLLPNNNVTTSGNTQQVEQVDAKQCLEVKCVYFNSGGHRGHYSTCVFWMRPRTRQLFSSLDRAENKERSSASASAAARADTKTYVLFRSRAVKGAFHEDTKRWGGGRSARHYYLPPALRVPFKRWVMSLAAILRPPLDPLSLPDVLPTFLEEVNKRTTWTRSIIFRRPTCDVRARPSNDIRVANVTT